MKSAGPARSGLYIWTILTFLVLWRCSRSSRGGRCSRRSTTASSRFASRSTMRGRRSRSSRASAESAKHARAGPHRGGGVVSRSRSDADRFREEMKAEGASRGDLDRAQRRAQIELETTRALQQIRQEAVDLSVGIASKSCSATCPGKTTSGSSTRRSSSSKPRAPAAKCPACYLHHHRPRRHEGTESNRLRVFVTPRPVCVWPSSGVSISSASRQRSWAGAFAYAGPPRGHRRDFEGIRRVGWGLVLILGLAGLRFVIRAECWRWCLPPAVRFPLPGALAAFLAGDAVGNVTPLGLLASEPTKVLLTRHHLAPRESVASLAVENLIYAASVLAMVGIGLLVVTDERSVAAQLDCGQSRRAADDGCGRGCRLSRDARHMGPRERARVHAGANGLRRFATKPCGSRAAIRGASGACSRSICCFTRLRSRGLHHARMAARRAQSRPWCRRSASKR